MADLLIGASVITVLLIARWMLVRALGWLAGRGEMSAVPGDDAGEAYVTDPDTTAAEPSVLLDEIYAYLEGPR